MSHAHPSCHRVLVLLEHIMLIQKENNAVVIVKLIPCSFCISMQVDTKQKCLRIKFKILMLPWLGQALTDVSQVQYQSI